MNNKPSLNFLDPTLAKMQILHDFDDKLLPAGPRRFSILEMWSRGLGGEIVKHIIDFLKEYDEGIQNKSYKYSLSIVLYSCWMAWLIQEEKHEDIIVKYHRDYNAYKGYNPFLNKISYPAHMEVIRSLEFRGLITNHKQTPGDTKCLSFYYATPELINMFQEFEKEINGIQVEDYRKDTVLLKNQSGMVIPPKKSSKEYLQLKKNVTLINKVNSSHSVTLDGLEVDTQLRRIFTMNSYHSGGRFYGDYQNLAKEDRARLLMDGESVVELDYTALHTTILYALQGKPVIKDPYTLGIKYPDPSELRQIVKTIMLIIYNLKDSQFKFQAFHAALKDEGLTPKIPVKDIYAAICITHMDLSIYFCKNKSQELQYRDAQLAERIMLRFAKDNEPILSIHDSFIVKKSQKLKLLEAMLEEFTNLYDQIPLVKENN